MWQLEPFGDRASGWKPLCSPSAGSTVPELVPLSLEQKHWVRPSPSQEAKRIRAVWGFGAVLRACLSLTPGDSCVLFSFTLDSSPFPRVPWKDLKVFLRTSPHVFFLPRSDLVTVFASPGQVSAPEMLWGPCQEQVP